MNRLLDSGQLTQRPCGANFAYELSNNGLFSPTEYKVLQSQANSCFIKCMKMLHNGRVQLFYLTGSLKPFAEIVPGVDAESFLTITANLLENINDVKHNGFLACQNIDISFDKIFVDPATHKVSLVYIPVNQRMFRDIDTFENELRTELVKLISGLAGMASPKIDQFAADLSDGRLKLEDLSVRLRGGRVDDRPKEAAQQPRCPTLHAIGTAPKVELPITKDHFVIGKNAAAVDGVVSFNKMISRVHCRIDRHGDFYMLTDLQSANGTYINHVRLHPNQPHPIKNGDTIRMANSDFRVTGL